MAGRTGPTQTELAARSPRPTVRLWYKAPRAWYGRSVLYSAERKVKARRRGRTRVSRKNQVTLPVASLAEAGVKPGDELLVRVEGDGRILLLRDHDPLDDFAGSIPGLAAATDLEALREEWER